MAKIIQQFEGYMSKGNNKELFFINKSQYYFRELWITKGGRREWRQEAWPPKRIRITIEELDAEKGEGDE